MPGSKLFKGEVINNYALVVYCKQPKMTFIQLGTT